MPLFPGLPSDLRALVHELADITLRSTREKRYDGGGFDISIEALHPDDQARLRDIYDATKKTYELWLYMRDAPNYDLMARHLTERFTQTFIDAAIKLGVPTMAQNQPAPPMLRKVLHDIRGGALAGVTGYVSLLAATKPRSADLKTWVEIATLMSRDHAKLIRNAVPDIDPVVR